jgi:N-acetylmuramoyl-L-alanine amidase
MKKNIVLLFLTIFLSGNLCGLVNATEPAATVLSATSETTGVAPSGTVADTSPPEPLLTNPLQIVHPTKNAKITAVSATFVCGSAPPDGKLTINGQPVTIDPGGGFLAMVDLIPGKFVITAELNWREHTYQATRTIMVAAPEQPAPVTPLTIEYVTPGQDQELLPGDTVTVVCKGSPGMKGYFTIKGVQRHWPLLESPSGMAGIYQGVYRINAKDRLHQSRIKVTLVDSRKKTVEREAPGRLSLFTANLPVIAQVAAADAVLRAGPALGPYDKGGYLLFPPEGTLLQLTGRRGNEYRVRLNDSLSVWVTVDQVKLLPEGTAIPRAVVGNLTVGRVKNTVQVRLPLKWQLPFQVEADSDGRYVDLVLFGAFSNTDRITNTAIAVVKQVNWFQDDRETYRLRVNTVPDSWWGYDARYEGRQLVLELRTPPPLTVGSNPLVGLTVAIDAGHGAGGGAMGPTGYAEGDANWAIAAVMQKKLQAKGVCVVLTRPGTTDVPLTARPKKAWLERADILISVHNNSLGYGGNPLQKHGFEIYYFTPMSYALAREIHRAYRESFGAKQQFPLPDGGLYYGNLALTRVPQMPAVLVESAYQIYPAEEAWLKTEEFREACAEAMISGLESYVRRMRRGTRND